MSFYGTMGLPTPKQYNIRAFSTKKLSEGESSRGFSFLIYFIESWEQKVKKP